MGLGRSEGAGEGVEAIMTVEEALRILVDAGLSLAEAEAMRKRIAKQTMNESDVSWVVRNLSAVTWVAIEDAFLSGRVGSHMTAMNYRKERE